MAGVLLLAIATLSLPPPKPLPLDGGGDIDTQALRYAAHLPPFGPAGSRYDASRDVTYLLVGCGHGVCETAIAVFGDHRDPPRQLLLEPSAQRGTRVPLTEPLGRADGVSFVIAEPFHLAPRWPGVLALEAGLLLTALGLVALAPRLPPWTVGLTGITTAVGIALGHRTSGSMVGLLTSVGSVGVILAGGTVLALGFAFRKPAVGAVGLALLAGGIVAMLTLFTIGPYYPTGGE